MGFRQLVRNLRKNSCVVCGKFMPNYCVEHKTLDNVTVPCHNDCKLEDKHIS